MASRSEVLTVSKGGINRERFRGGALKDSLYDLLNAYITPSKTIRIRPAALYYETLPDDSNGDSLVHGLCAHNNALHVFATEYVAVPDGFILHIINHPDQTDSDGTPIPIKRVHFAKPFLGYLYVAVEFNTQTAIDGGYGDVYHYWLQGGSAWEASKDYKVGDIVTPATPTGLSYVAKRSGSANQQWLAGVQRALGDVVEPTTFNNFEYTVIDTLGSNPRSGSTEPDWPTDSGAQVIEEADSTPASAQTAATTTDTSATPSPDIMNRYWNWIWGINQ
jgi:hypothetical protein